MEGRYSLYKQGGGGVWRSFRNGDFEEGDVWAVLEGRKDCANPTRAGNSRETDSFTSTPRMIPRSTCKNPTHETKLVQQSSAPVNIPDWSKIYAKNISSKKGSKNASWLDDDSDADVGYDGNDVFVNDGDYSDEEEEEDDDDEHDCCKLPPHEWIARRLASSHISSFSVFEGAGRTLKGRDLSKVRNAILTKTGFLE